MAIVWKDERGVQHVGRVLDTHYVSDVRIMSDVWAGQTYLRCVEPDGSLESIAIDTEGFGRNPGLLSFEIDATPEAIAQHDAWKAEQARIAAEAAQISLGVLTSDDFSASAPHDSDRWATTDRGWLYDEAHPDRGACDRNLPVGNYLDYGPCGEHYRAQPQGSVHACFTPWSYDRGIRRYPTESSWHTTVAQAQAWIAEQYRAWTAEHVNTGS